MTLACVRLTKTSQHRQHVALWWATGTVHIIIGISSDLNAMLKLSDSLLLWQYTDKGCCDRKAINTEDCMERPLFVKWKRWWELTNRKLEKQWWNMYLACVRYWLGSQLHKQTETQLKKTIKIPQEVIVALQTFLAEYVLICVYYLGENDLLFCL